MIYIFLFWEFFKAGLFAIGGGLSTIPFIYGISDRWNWISHAQIADMIAISEATPGPIGVNMATFTGFQIGGIPGAAVATLALVLPSVIVIILIARFMQRFKEHHLAKSVFEGLRPATAGLIAAAAFTVIELAIYGGWHGELLDIIKLKELGLFALVWFLVWKFHWHPVFYLAGAAAVGIVLKL